MRNHEIAKLFCSNSPMQEIYKTEKDVIIIGAWSRDVGTRECRLEIEAIHKAVIAQASQLQIQADSDGKSSLSEVYQALCEYVGTYEEPGRVFVRDGYGNILASYLQTVLDKLELGYTRLELQKNFKAWGLLRTNQGTGHVYSYKINTGSANDWYFSFKLQGGSEAA